MVIIFVEFIVLLVLLRKQMNIHKTSILFFTFLIQFILLFVYRVELKFLWNRDVYWSDAEYYWENTLRLLNGIPTIFYNSTYVYYSYLIQKTSPFYSPLWNNISNLFLINLSFFLGIEITKPIERKKKLPIILYLTSVANPLVIYSLIRNLKDSLFLFIVILSIYILVKIQHINVSIRYMILPLYFYTFLFLLNNIRPWGFMVVFSNIIIFLLLMNPGKFSKIISFIVLLGIIFGLFQAQKFLGTIQIWLMNRENLIEYGIGSDTSNFGLLTLFIGFFRMLMGPGPIRSIFGTNYFMYYTYTGLVASFIGSLIWWFLFPVLLGKVVSKLKDIFQNNFLYVTVVLLMILLIYTYFYGGSTELRFRGILYILITLVAIPTIISPEKENKKMFNVLTEYVILSSLLVIPSLFFSI